MKVYCEDCKFSWMEMVSDENASPCDGGKWHQEWVCKNPLFATRSNAVNKPFVSKVDCIKYNKNNDCSGFEEKTFQQKHLATIRLISIFIVMGVLLIITILTLK